MAPRTIFLCWIIFLSASSAIPQSSALRMLSVKPQECFSSHHNPRSGLGNLEIQLKKSFIDFSLFSFLNLFCLFKTRGLLFLLWLSWIIIFTVAVKSDDLVYRILLPNEQRRGKSSKPTDLDGILSRTPLAFCIYKPMRYPPVDKCTFGGLGKHL